MVPFLSELLLLGCVLDCYVAPSFGFAGFEAFELFEGHLRLEGEADDPADVSLR
jgi:predicted cupin superfamily sugar epimerase